MPDFQLGAAKIAFKNKDGEWKTFPAKDFSFGMIPLDEEYQPNYEYEYGAKVEVVNPLRASHGIRVIEYPAYVAGNLVTRSEWHCWCGSSFDDVFEANVHIQKMNARRMR